MQSMIYALVDCNNFFVSCERVFNPKLRGRPVVVLSNNDGCVVSRSNEAKKLGIAMGEPFFKIRELTQRHGVVALSSNFALYGDLSARVMSTIMHNFPEVAVYSIDEAFIDFSSLANNFDIYKACVKLMQKIEHDTGIPVSIGIATSKTLAKVANHIAKCQNNLERVYSLDTAQKIDVTLSDFAVGDVWGIGRKIEKKLHSMGVYTVAELLKLPNVVIKSNFNIVFERILLELQGISCIELKDNSAKKKQIMISRSFAERVVNLLQLQEALATYTSMACEKLRKQRSLVGGIYVFLHTGLHGRIDTVYKNSLYIKLPYRSSDTRTIIKHAFLGLTQLFKKGFRYQKVGIILCDLSDADNMQIDLFGHTTLDRSEKLMALIDNINQKFGRTTIQLAASGLEKTWQSSAKRISGNFTSAWEQLPIIKVEEE